MISSGVMCNASQILRIVSILILTEPLSISAYVLSDNPAISATSYWVNPLFLRNPMYYRYNFKFNIEKEGYEFKNHSILELGYSGAALDGSQYINSYIELSYNEEYYFDLYCSNGVADIEEVKKCLKIKFIDKYTLQDTTTDFLTYIKNEYYDVFY